jgi:hypothetical protein
MNAASPYIHSATAPGVLSPENTRDFPRLACRWHRDVQGRLSCVWTRNSGPSSVRLKEGEQNCNR